MQNKQAIIGIIAAAVILFGAVGVFLYSQKNQKSEPNSTAVTESPKEKASMDNDIISILKSGKTQKCTFATDDANGGTTTGTSYISGDMMRTDIANSKDGKSSNIYVIRNGDDNYIWGSDFPSNTGMKMTLSIDEYEVNENAKKYFDPNMKADYKCSAWTVDSALFTPPASIKFQDLSAMMKGLIQSVSKSPTGTTNSASSECTICNSLSGEAKSACLKQFSC